MTGHRCIVPGCKSGYDSCVNKHHFFTAPKDPARLEQWKKAIPRKNFLIKTRQAVCELRFHEEDIIRTKVISTNNRHKWKNCRRGRKITFRNFFILVPIR